MKVAALAIVTSLSFSSAAFPATLDFTVFEPFKQGTNTLALPEATITGFGSELFITPPEFVSSGICALAPGDTCEADLQIDFVRPVSNLSFLAGGFEPRDSIVASVFGANGLLASNEIGSDGVVSFGSLSGITRLFFDDDSSSGGASYDGFSFAQVPLPASLWFMLMLAAAGIAGGTSRRVTAV
jgi:hypothetical protein